MGYNRTGISDFVKAGARISGKSLTEFAEEIDEIQPYLSSILNGRERNERVRDKVTDELVDIYTNFFILVVGDRLSKDDIRPRIRDHIEYLWDKSNN